MVAEDGCKWYATEPDPGKPSLADCRPVQEYAEQHGNSFRGHNTFWHQELPVRATFSCPLCHTTDAVPIIQDWLPGNFSAHELVDNIIPTHVRAVCSLYGLILHQSYRYLRLFPNDRAVIRIFVSAARLEGN